jgi:flagellar hook-associated protein 3 FlgL
VRITQSMMKDQITNNIDSILERISTLQNQSSSGNKFTLPYQDPTDAVLTVNYQSSLNQITTNTSALQQVQGTLKGYDNMIGQITSSVQQINALVVQAANGTNTPADRQAIADQVEQLRNSIAQDGNTNVSGTYVFAGATNSQPVSPLTSGSATTYFYTSTSATGANLTLNLGNAEIDTNVTLQQLFGYKGQLSNSLISYSTGGSISYSTGGSMLNEGLLDKIIQDLQNNDVSNLSGPDLKDLQSYENSLAVVTTQVGSQEQAVQNLITSNQNLNTYVTQLMSTAQGTDMVKVLSDLSLQETVYQAALQTSASSLLPTLANFLSGSGA